MLYFGARVQLLRSDIICILGLESEIGRHWGTEDPREMSIALRRLLWM